MEQSQTDFWMSIGGIQTQNDSLRNLRQAMQFIPANEKQAFLEACRLCPGLIQQESNPMRFLAREEFNTWKAAVRLAKYWTTRMELCGPDRAFRPIFDLSGEGALLPSTVDLIATGLGVILPPDEHGKPVLFIDRLRVPPELHVEIVNRRQLGFYFLTKVMTMHPSFVAILYLDAKPRFIPGMAGWFTDVIVNVFPLKVHAVHIVCRSPRSAFQRFVQTFVPIIMRLSSKSYGIFKITLDIGEKDELRKKLIFYEMLPERLPAVVDGTWTYDIFDDWIESEKKRSNVLFQLAADVSQVSSESCGLELLAAAVKHQDGKKIQSCTEFVENERKTDEESTNKFITLPTNVMIGKDRGRDDEAAVGSPSMMPMVGGSHRSPSISLSGPDSVRRVLDEFPQDKKASYCEAIQYASNIVEAETDLVAFLALEDGNAQTAATRVISYWNIRKMLFKERAYLPLQQSGDGALNSDDLRILKCGYITLLPKDEKGRSVICCDASRLEKDCIDSRLRCFFYMLQVAKEDAQDTKGIAILLVMNKLSFERTRVHSSLTQLLKVFPVKVAAIHIVRQPARLGARFFDEKVVPTLKSLFRSVNAAIHAHSGTPDCDLRKIMARFDFDSENLPRSLGGGWTYQDFSQWLGQRLIMEQTSSLQPNLKTTLGESSQNGASSVLAMQPQAQLTTMFNKAQIDTECLLQSVLADHAMRLTRQSCDQSHHLYTTDQTLTQLLEINRIQHEGGSGQIDASSVEWNSGRLTANVQAQRSVAESASTINAGGPSPMTHRWLNGLANSVPASPNVNARRWEEMSSLN